MAARLQSGLQRGELNHPRNLCTTLWLFVDFFFAPFSGSKVCAQHRLRQPLTSPVVRECMHLSCFHSSMPSVSRLLAASFSANKATGNKFVRNQCARRGFECFLNPSNAFRQRSTHCKGSQCSKSQAASSVHMLMFGCCKRT